MSNLGTYDLKLSSFPPIPPCSVAAVWNVPLSVIVDRLFLDTGEINVQTVAGGVLVAFGFVGITRLNHNAEREKQIVVESKPQETKNHNFATFGDT